MQPERGIVNLVRKFYYQPVRGLLIRARAFYCYRRLLHQLPRSANYLQRFFIAIRLRLLKRLLKSLKVP